MARTWTRRPSRRALRAAELTDAELDQYKQRAATALAKMQGKSGRAAQSDAETVSAHSAIASFAGVSNWASGGVAKFYIDRYLKYAHIADNTGNGGPGDTVPASANSDVRHIGIHAQDLLCAMTSMAVRASGSLPLPRNIAHRWASCTGKYLS